MPPPLASHGMCLNIMNERNAKDGMGSTAKPLKFWDQDYYSLLDFCHKNNVRFVDENFPPDPPSIGKDLLDRKLMDKIEWKRPMKIAPNAQFVVDGVSRFDYAQGNVGNCWFLASVGALTFQEKLFQQIIPAGQSLTHQYAGIFHFRFWRFGRWYDVVIDDKLPTINGELIFVQSKTRNEFWPALLEKAYAKVCGSYADMHAGRVSEALMDFTGGVHLHFELKSAPTDLWQLMYRASQARALMGCETAGRAREKKIGNGIVLGHAYTITGVYKATSDGHPVHLVRLFNPWGDTEWNGDWSDKSTLWNTVTERDRKENLLAENGEFWMSVKDFISCFDNMDICSHCPDFLEDVHGHWTTKYHYGQWVTGSTAGGAMNYKDTFCKNPQFWLRVNEMSKKCEDGHNNVLVSLIQKPDKRNRRSVSVHAIGFSVFAIPPEISSRSEEKFGASFFLSRMPVETSGRFDNVRQVTKFFRLEPGHYLIVPSTDTPNQNAEFFLSIICKNDIQIEKDTERTEKGYLVDFTKVHSDQVEEKSRNKQQNVALFRQYSDQYKDVDAGQLQQLLHKNIFGEDIQMSEGFGLDTCRSLIAMSDSSVTGKLDGSEFMCLWNRILEYKDIFYSMDSTKDGVLSVNELNNALEKTGMNLSEDILTLMTVRYGGVIEQISLEGFICLVMRLKYMASIFQRLCDGRKVTLDESEWIRLTMYS